ncbi:hypothetical protein DCS_03114 [Drechmeria coniospora]|uniref:Uncharacterized protein n=1 Tax=Drechmeria coniospora TaxID=98403 RepID=A0A151GXY0_DRECN|nr:hypothetical protein DCS_03114 [Drechmeria coniospora]KYK61969.1 hypothetical protein DCS_03114 [Drechmeria coniospora]
MLSSSLRAAASISDTYTLRKSPELVEKLVRTWLESPHVGVGDHAAGVIHRLLENDLDLAGDGPSRDSDTNADVGAAGFWDLITQQEPILSIIRDLCSYESASHRTELDVTISQGRLLQLLPRLAVLNLEKLMQSGSPHLFPLPALPAIYSDPMIGKGGLLPWAALNMIDKSDEILYRNLIAFFQEFVLLMHKARREQSSKPTSSPMENGSGAGRQQRDGSVKSLIQAACSGDSLLPRALLAVPDDNLEDDSADYQNDLKGYISQLLN